MNETLRQLNELAISFGRSMQSSETGFLHLSHTSSEETNSKLIPLYENALFALALFKAKTQESVAEAKNLMTKILPFQAPSGNFPIYLHEYPNCLDKFQGANLLPIFYWILHDFHTILGADLKKILEESAEKLLHFSLENCGEKIPNFLAFKIAGAATRFGKLKEGEALLSKLSKEPKDFYYYSPEHLAEMFFGWQMLSPSLKNSSLLNDIQNFWNPVLKTYLGPNFKTYQRQKQPEVTAYDYILGVLTGAFSERALMRHPSQLKAALIRPWNESLNATGSSCSGEVKGFTWQNIQEKDYAFSLIEKNSDLPFSEKGFSPFYFLFGCPDQPQSLVLQGGNIQKTAYQLHEGKIELFLDLKEGVDPEDRVLSREVAFYTEDVDSKAITVEGNASTTFKLGEVIKIDHPSKSLSLAFDLIEGSGTFLGHINKGNRPSQIAKNSLDRYAAYDWQIFLRTLNRTHPCKLKLTISF